MNFTLPVGSLEKSVSLIIASPDLEKEKKSHNESPVNLKEKSCILFEICVFILTSANTMKQFNHTRNSLLICGMFLVFSVYLCYPRKIFIL